MSGFITFLREQGVAGLAIGFILGAAISDLVAALVNDVVNPVIGIFLAERDSLSEATIHVRGAEVLWGSLLTALIDFLVIALIVYVAVRVLKLHKVDPKGITMGGVRRPSQRSR